MGRKAILLAMSLLLLVAHSASAVMTNVVVPIVTGWNLLSNPLNNPTNNGISAVLPNPPWGTTVYFWTGSNLDWFVFDLDNMWKKNGSPSEPILIPGQGFFLLYEPPTNPPPLVFGGEVIESPPPIACPGYCLVGLRSPTPGDFEHLTGFPPPTNALVQSFIGCVGSDSGCDFAYQNFHYDGANWTPFAPVFEPGRGYWVFTNYLPPRITVPPQSQIVSPGATVTLIVTATGTVPLHYQWRFTNAPLSNQTRSNLTLTNFMTSRVGAYDVIVSNFAGVVTSAVAVLYLPPPTFPDDSFPPSWMRGSNGTTYQAWSLDNANSDSNVTFNPRGQPVVRPDGNATSHSFFQGRSNVWELRGAGGNTNPPVGRLRLAIPNYGDTNPIQLRLQVTFHGAAPNYSVYVPTGGVPAFSTNGPRQRIARDNGWTNELTVWEFSSCPLVVNVVITSGGTMAIDQVIADTICQPAPLPPPAPTPAETISSPACLPNGTFRFLFSGQPGSAYITEYSANLRDWTPLQTNVANASIEIVDPAAAHAPQRFYRVRLLRP